MGRVAAKLGDTEVAKGSFGSACSVAKEARCYLLQLMAAREWKKAIPDATEPESIIDEACTKVEKFLPHC